MPKTVQISAEFVGLQNSLEKSISAAIAKFGSNSVRIPFDNKALGDFNNQLDRATQRVITLGTAFSVLSLVNRSIRNMVSATVEVEKSLANVNTIFKLTNESLNRFSGALFDISRNTASSFNDVSKAATEFARQGLSVAETQKAVSAALMLSRDAGIDVEESVKALTSATNSFNKEALSRLQIANRLASVDSAFAVSSKDLAEALIRTGSAASDAGVSFNQLIGLVTSAQQISQRGGSVIAGALNTIFTRINRRDTLSALESLGVTITDINGKALPTIQVLQNFANAYDKMAPAVKNASAELVGGVRQLNTLKAALRDLAEGEGSVFNQVQNVIKLGGDALERRNAERNKTLSATLSQMSSTAQQIGSNFGRVGLTPHVQPILSGILDNPVTKALKDASGSAETEGGKIAESLMKGFGSVLTYSIAPLAIKVLATVVSRVSSNLFRDISATADLNKAEKERLTTESLVVEAYKAGGAALQKQLSTMSTMTEKAALLESVMTRMSQSAAETQALVQNVSSLPSIGIRRVPRSAEGYIPMSEESRAISMGVGGAPSNARPVYLPNFNRGGGKLGIVANTSEFIAPTAAGGAIFNREMIQKYGLPPGSMPVAAGGHIPNAAQGSYTPQELGFGWSKAGDIKTQELNKLFDSLKSAATLEQAYQFGPKIIDMAKSLGHLAETSVLKDMSALFNNLSFQKNIKNWNTSQKITNGPYAIIPSTGIEPETDEAQQIRLAGIEERKKTEAKKIKSRSPQNIEANVVSRAEIDRLNARSKLYSAQEAEASATAQATRPWLFRKLSEFGGNFAPGTAPSGPNFLSRTISKIGGNPMAMVGASIGASMLSGMIDEGQGGTEEGKRRGMIKGGLSGFGTGAMIGSFIGPEGALIGGGIGAAVGGLIGAISKSSKSFEELSTEIDQKTKKMTEELTSVNEIFRMQGELKDAIAADNQEQVIALKQQIALNKTKVSDPRYLDIIGKYSGRPEEGAVAATKLGNSILIPQMVQGNLRSALYKGKTTGGDTAKGILSSAWDYFSSVATGVRPMGNIYSGLVGNIAESVSGYTPKDLSEEDKTSTKKAIMAALANLSQGQRDSLRKKASTNLAGAAELVGRVGGVTGVDLQAMIDSVKKDPNYARMFKGGLSSGLNELDLMEKLSAGEKEKMEAEIQKERSFMALSQRYKAQGVRAGISGSAESQVFSAQQRVALSNPALTEENRLIMMRNQRAAQLEREAGIKAQQDIFSGKSKLTEIIGKSSKSEELKQLVGGITDLQSAKALAARISTEEGRVGLGEMKIGPESDFVKALNALIEELDNNSFSQKAHTDALNKILGIETKDLQFKQSYAGALNADQGRLNAINKQVSVAIQQNAGQDVIDPLLRQQELVEYDAKRRQYVAGFTDQGMRALQTRQSFEANIQGGRRSRRAILDVNQTNPSLVTGADLSSALYGEAMDLGRQGQAKESFVGGFTSVFAGLKKDIKQFGDVGKQVADSLANSFSGAFGDFVTGAKSAKDAFRSFVVTVLQESARAFATKAVVSLLSMFLGNIGTGGGGTGATPVGAGDAWGLSATGGPIKRANGGAIPTMLTGGEYVYPPVQAARLGGRMLNALNTGTMRTFAPGGLVRGGSGVKDDVFQPLAEGSYVIRKSMVERYGANNLASLSIGGYPDITGSAASAMRFAEGGPVASMMATPTPMSVESGSGGGTFNIGVTINDNTTTSSSDNQSKPGSGLGDQRFGQLLAARMKQVALQTIEEQKRMGGMLRPQSNLRTA